MQCLFCHSEIPEGSVFCPACESRQTTVSETQDFAYAAFISYRHLPRDKKIARKVQQAIETFKLPKGIQSTNTAAPDASNSNTVANRTLGKCFRDEDELAASHSLPERIRQALDQSQTLIVICTPDTSDSAWIQREIEEFIRLHGRQHIVAVLADGSSSESIPDILKIKHTINTDGDLIAEPTEPLAADLRSSSASDHKTELLRVIAAVAGCGYDDLRQRQRRRKRQHIAIGGACAIVIAAVIATLIVWGLSPSEEQLIAESKDLAAQSQQQLAQGDRMGAIKTALTALPASSTDTSRPIVAEAQTALEIALQVNHTSQGVWCPSFTLETPGNAASFTSSTEGSWVAILDDTYMVSVFDLRTGAFRFSINLADYTSKQPSETQNNTTYEDPREQVSNEWTLLAAGTDKLIIANRTGEGALACFDANTGACRWIYDQVVVSSIALSEDQTEMAVYSIFNKYAILVACFDVDSGDTIDWAQFDNQDVLETPIFLSGYLDSATQKSYLGLGGILMETNFDTGILTSVTHSDYLITSLNGYDDVVVAASSYTNKETPGQNIPYSIAATKNGETLWHIDDTYDFDLVGTPYQGVAIDAKPQAIHFLNWEGRAIAVTAGSKLKIIGAAEGTEGDVLFANDLSQAIVGLGVGYQEDNHDMLYVATADGALDICIYPYDNTLNSKTMRTPLPWAIDEATIQWYEHRDLLAVLKSAEPSTQTLVYRLDLDPLDRIIEASLDDMIEAGQEMLMLNEGGEGSLDLVNNPLSRFAPEYQ